MRLLKLARMTASALMYLLNGDCEENFVNNDLSKNLHLDDLSNYKLTNAFSALVQARLRISFEGNSYDKAAKDVRLIANVEYLESALQGDVTNIFSNISIILFIFIFNNKSTFK